MRTKRVVTSVAVIFLFVFWYCVADAAPPQVIATNPPSGTFGVRPDIDTIQILFDKPILWPDIFPGTSCMTVSANWPAIVVSVIGSDGLLYHFARTTKGTDLPLGSHVELTLNPPGAANTCFRDQEGTLLPTYNLNFTVRQNEDDPPSEPQVVSTYPSRGATGVDPNISSISITFSKPMAQATVAGLGSWYLSYGWGSSSQSWSPDGKTLTITRSNAGTPLPEGQTVMFVLNWDLSMRLQATDGNVLQEHTHFFTVEGDRKAFYESFYDVAITKIPANPAKGFHWPYYLSIPNSLGSPSTLFVEPNNSGYPALDFVFHDTKAAEILYARTATMNAVWNLDLPLLVPVFPRTYDEYIQAMNLWLPSNCNCPELERPDLQLVAMIKDAQGRLRSMGHIMDHKVFMNGFSASGAFTGGFTMLHPDLIRAAASGGGLPDEYDPQRRFQLEGFTGQQIDLHTYFSVPLYLYVGDQDGNYNPALWLAARQFYESGGANAQLVLYPGVGHAITSQMWSDLGDFFQRYNTVSDIVQKVYIGYYQRPADPAGLIYWTRRLEDADWKLHEIIEAYAHSAESVALYGNIDSGSIGTVVDSIYMALFNRHAETGGLNYYVNGFNSGQFTAATIMLNILNGAQNQDLLTVNNKVTASNLFTKTIDPELDGANFQVTYVGVPDAIKARNWLTSVTWNVTTVPTQDETTTYMKSNIADPNDPILNH